MTYAFDELYLSGAQRILGDMYDYAVNSLHISLTHFHEMFLISGIARQFEIGNPMYVAGKNGCEVAKEVLVESGLDEVKEEDVMYVDKSREYWIGWALAYVQWNLNTTFARIQQCVPIEEMYAMYSTYHEEDIDSFSQYMMERLQEYRKQSALKRIRAYANYSQSQLAKVSDVPIRQIQMFEQGKRDINKTQGDTLSRLAKGLHCKMEDLLI